MYIYTYVSSRGKHKRSERSCTCISSTIYPEWYRIEQYMYWECTGNGRIRKIKQLRGGFVGYRLQITKPLLNLGCFYQDKWKDYRLKKGRWKSLCMSNNDSNVVHIWKRMFSLQGPDQVHCRNFFVALELHLIGG